MAKPKAGRMPVTGLEVPKCPVCMDDMTLPIFQCQTGHSVCHACTKGLVPPRCPLCSQMMTQMRNWQLEELVDKAKKECPNKAVGCGYIMTASEINNHLKECFFREMNCPHGEVFGACSWTGTVKDLFEHFKSNHAENCGIRLDQETDLRVNSSSDNRLMFMLSQGKYLFLFTIKIDTYQKMIYYVIQHIGIKKFAQQFVYEINIVSKKDSRRKVIFIDHCLSDTCDIKEIFSNGTCGIMPLGMFAHFVENDRFTLKISITNEAFVKNSKDYAKKDKNEYTKKGPNTSRSYFRSKSPGPHMEDCKAPHKGPRWPRKQESLNDLTPHKGPGGPREQESQNDLTPHKGPGGPREQESQNDLTLTPHKGPGGPREQESQNYFTPHKGSGGPRKQESQNDLTPHKGPGGPREQESQNYFIPHKGPGGPRKQKSQNDLTPHKGPGGPREQESQNDLTPHKGPGGPREQESQNDLTLTPHKGPGGPRERESQNYFTPHKGSGGPRKQESQNDLTPHKGPGGPREQESQNYFIPHKGPGGPRKQESQNDLTPHKGPGGPREQESQNYFTPHKGPGGPRKQESQDDLTPHKGPGGPRKRESKNDLCRLN